jgi:DNA invertase Pin-like site-specific DNA recombinase
MTEHNGRYVSYLRVSTQRQGRSGLGLEAQRKAVTDFLNGGRWELLNEFVETESGKGRDALRARPVLRDALDHCKKHKATLLVAKLDRLSRNVAFLSALMESKVEFTACDFPQANRLTVHILGAVAEHEREMISQRTKAALAAAKARGVKLGNPRLQPDNEKRRRAARDFAESLRPTLEAYKAQGYSQRQMVDALNGMGVHTPRGGAWSLMQLQRVLVRMGESGKRPRNAIRSRQSSQRPAARSAWRHG